MRQKIRLEFVDITQIQTDYSYQRPLDEKRVARIAKAFKSGAAKAISLSLRADGSLNCYDGNTTLHAMLRLGYTHVPAIVVKGNPEQEARWFLTMNGIATKRVTPREMQGAGLVAKEDKAIAAKEFLSEFGLTVSSGGNRPHQTSSIGFIRDAAVKNPDTLRASMQIIVRLWPDEPESWCRNIMRGMFEVCAAGMGDQVARKLKSHKITPRRILDVASGMQISTGQPGSGAGYMKKAILQLAKMGEPA